MNENSHRMQIIYWIWIYSTSFTCISQVGPRDGFGCCQFSISLCISLLQMRCNEKWYEFRIGSNCNYEAFQRSKANTICIWILCVWRKFTNRSNCSRTNARVECETIAMRTASPATLRRSHAFNKSTHITKWIWRKRREKKLFARVCVSKSRRATTVTIDRNNSCE